MRTTLTGLAMAVLLQAAPAFAEDTFLLRPGENLEFKGVLSPDYTVTLVTYNLGNTVATLMVWKENTLDYSPVPIEIKKGAPASSALLKTQCNEGGCAVWIAHIRWDESEDTIGGLRLHYEITAAKFPKRKS